MVNEERSFNLDERGRASTAVCDPLERVTAAVVFDVSCAPLNAMLIRSDLPNEALQPVAALPDNNHGNLTIDSQSATTPTARLTGRPGSPHDWFASPRPKSTTRLSDQRNPALVERG